MFPLHAALLTHCWLLVQDWSNATTENKELNSQDNSTTEKIVLKSQDNSTTENIELKSQDNSTNEKIELNSQDNSTTEKIVCVRVYACMCMHECVCE
jgi:hypothetical protein